MKVYFVSDQNEVGRTVNRIQVKKQSIINTLKCLNSGFNLQWNQTSLLWLCLYIYCNHLMYLFFRTSDSFFLPQVKNPTSALMKAAANVTLTLATASNTPAPTTLTSLTTARWQDA